MTFLTILENTELLCRFRLVLGVKTGKEIPKTSRLEFLGKKILSNNIALSGEEDNASRPLNRGDRGDIADLLLLRTLLAIRQKSQEPRFWKVMESLTLLAYASLAALRTLLQ